jgi:GntR family transcriptional repressor for pyruvate dehydrogenase complex
MGEVLRKPRLSMQVAVSLCTHMVERELGPDDRLPAERDLAEMFAVSRQVVREALRQLEARGLVSVDHGRGTIVRARPGPDDLAVFTERLGGSPAVEWEVSLEARAAFEASLAELIVARVTEADIERLAAIVSNMERAVQRGQGIGADDVAFHELLLRCTGNSLLIEVGRHLVLGYLQSSLIERFGQNLAASEIAELEARERRFDLAEHQEIVAAIQRRDVDRLRPLLRYHAYRFDAPERIEAGLPGP